MRERDSSQMKREEKKYNPVRFNIFPIDDGIDPDR